jgi:hypothetical protein
MSTDKTIRRFASHEEQRAATYRYWQSRPAGERLAAVWEATLAAWSAKGFRYDPSKPSDKTITRRSLRGD